MKLNIWNNFVLFTRLKAKATSAVLEQISVSAKVFMKFLLLELINKLRKNIIYESVDSTVHNSIYRTAERNLQLRVYI